MRRIEIITPQHVPIQYQLATVRERGLAFFLDFVILACCTLFLYLIIAFATSTGETTQTFAYLIIVPFYTFYSIFFESLMNGQTPGKLAVKIHVIKLTGTDLSFSDYMLRWMFRWLDIWISFGSIAALLVSSSRKGQRLGDVLADTAVVRVTPDYYVSLTNLLSIKSTDSHELLYPEARIFKEEEMLLVKQVLDRFKAHKNPAHTALLKQTAIGVSERLGLEKQTVDPVEFLSRVLVDYVTSTRSG